jgi:predicted metal-dependent enzyme (double-stranded beta helix superfamily)
MEATSGPATTTTTTATTTELSWPQLLEQVADVIRAASEQRYRSAADQSCRRQQPAQREPSMPLNECHKRRLMSLCERYHSEPADFEQYVRYDPSGYTKNLVMDVKPAAAGDDTLLANVIVMCWAPGQASAFHAHEGSRCVVKVLRGQVKEWRLAHPGHRQPQSQATPASTCVLTTNQVAYIDDQIGCHRVANESDDEPAVTLHVYVPAYTKCRVFHLDDNHRVVGHVAPGTESAGVAAAADDDDKPISLTMQRSQVVDVVFE